MEKENADEKKKKKKVIIIIIVIILLLIGGFIYWWFNRMFDVTIKYNNGFPDRIAEVKYLHKVSDVPESITDEYNDFLGWFETYNLNNKEKEKINNDTSLESSICKEGFKLNTQKDKCVSEKEFDFENTKIKKDTTIEAMWKVKSEEKPTITFTINPTTKSINVGDTFTIATKLTGTDDKKINWSVKDSSIATVDKNGKVKGVKAGTTVITAVSNGISRTCNLTVVKKEEPVKPQTPPEKEPEPVVDNGKISLNASNACIVGYFETTTITATLKDAIDKTVNWTLPKCYTKEQVSDTVVKLNRTGRGTMCRTEEERTFTVSAKLNNGNSNSVTINYEPTLEVRVYDDGREIQPDASGNYNGNKITIKTNAKANFSASNSSYISSKTDTTVTLSSTSDNVVTIKTGCGQTKTIKVFAVIN